MDGTSQKLFSSSDTVRAFDLILRKGTLIYNIGCDEGMEYTVLESLDFNQNDKKTDNYQQWVEYVDDRPFNDKILY